MPTTISHDDWNSLFDKAQSSGRFDDADEALAWMRRKWRDADDLF